jgi:hypothetical protein
MRSNGELSAIVDQKHGEPNVPISHPLSIEKTASIDFVQLEVPNKLTGQLSISPMAHPTSVQLELP